MVPITTSIAVPRIRAAATTVSDSIASEEPGCLLVAIDLNLVIMKTDDSLNLRKGNGLRRSQT